MLAVGRTNGGFALALAGCGEAVSLVKQMLQGMPLLLHLLPSLCLVLLASLLVALCPFLHNSIIVAQDGVGGSV